MHGYLRAFTTETHAQVSETVRTGAAAGHSGESAAMPPSDGVFPSMDHTLQYTERIKRLGTLHIEINMLAFVMDHIHYVCMYILLLCVGLPCLVFIITWYIIHS